MGQYEGNMVTTGDVEIAATGRVSGNMHTHSLVMFKGGFFNGNVSKISAEEAQSADGQRAPRAVYLLEDKRLGQQKVEREG